MKGINNSPRIASIDIGSNAVRLLIKSIEVKETSTELKKLLLVRVPLRLGQESFTTGKISDSKAKKLLKLLKSFKLLMDIYDVEKYRACATSAMRDSSNSDEIVQKIADKTNLKIEIITGTEEASIIYESHFADSLRKNLNYIYVDVGGGSTEISLIREGVMMTSKSYNIGTVRLLNDKVDPAEFELMHNDLEELKSNYNISNIIGSGGNIIKLNTLVHKSKNITKLPLVKLEQLYESLKNYSIDELMEIYKLRQDRADVIVPAAFIYIDVARCIGVNDFIVPRIGLTDGIAHLIFEKWKEKNDILN